MATTAEQLATLQKAVNDLRASANAQGAFMMSEQQAADVLRRGSPPLAPLFALLQTRMDALRGSLNAQASLLITEQQVVDAIAKALTPGATIAARSVTFLVGGAESWRSA